MAQSITFEQFLHHTNAEEIIVKKMKEAGPRIYQLNYDRRLKHCNVLYKKFYDIKLRASVLDYGLVLKPMPNSFKSKFLQFPINNNNDGDYNTSDTTGNISEKKKQTKSPDLEDKYKNDLPCTSSAFVHKPRIVSPCGKNKSQSKTVQKTYSIKGQQQQSPTKNNSKSTLKRRISLKKPKSSTKSPKITNYFPSNADDELNSKQTVKLLRKRISDPPNEDIEIEPPQTKILKSSPVKKIDTNSLPKIIESKIGPKSSKRDSNDKKIKNKTKREYRSNGKENSLQKKSRKSNRMRLYSDDFVSDDCDINTNNSLVNVTIEDSKEESSPNRNIEINSSPSKSALPKRNRTEDYGKVLNNISKELLKEISPEKRKNGFSNNEIELWIKDGLKALEKNDDNNIKSFTGDRTYREDVRLDHKLQTVKTNPDKVKKYIKYWLNFKIQRRKGLNLEATVSEISKAKMLSAFGQITYVDFKNVINIQKHISRWASLGKSVTELEENFKNQHRAFIQKEKSWPKVHIELARLQSYLHSKGIKGTIPLKNIPPRILSFDEVLERTNIKECISLNCDRPPESYKELLSLCKKEYEKCCCKGVWTEELKFVDKNEEVGSSQEMSIELFTEPSMSMSPLKITSDSGSIKNFPFINQVVQKELGSLKNLDGSGPSNIARTEISSNKQFELVELSKDSTKVHSAKSKKSSKYGPKSRRKQSSRNDDDDLELQISHICGDNEQHVPTNPLIKPIDTQELNHILTHIQTQPPNDNEKDIQHSERRISEDVTNCEDSVKRSLEKVADNNQTNNTKLALNTALQPPRVDKGLTPSPNIFASSGETNVKCSSAQVTNETATKNLLESSEADSSNFDGKNNLIPPSPNIFLSSGESRSKCEDTDSIRVQTQESVYVPCESNNNFHTEQYNYSISMNEVSQSKDPFGEIIANQDETDVIILDSGPASDKSEILMKNISSSCETMVPEQVSFFCKEVSAQASDTQHTHSGELNSSIQNLDSGELVDNTMQNIIDSQETIVLRNLLLSHQPDMSKPEQVSLSCKGVLANPLETSNSQLAQSNELNVSGNSDSNKVADKTTNNTSTSETATLSTSSKSNNNNNQKQTTETSMPSTGEIVDETNCSSMPVSHPHTVTVELLADTVFDKKKENSVSTAQSIEPIKEGHNVAPKLSKSDREQNMKLLEENVQPMEPDQNSSVPSAVNQKDSFRNINVAVNQEDTNQDETQTADHNTNSNKNEKESVENLEINLNSSISGDSMRNAKVVVKREFFPEQYSEYCDDVEIIEVPQSEAMVIDDEETAPELLEALLCNSTRNESIPMTIVHTTISHATSSTYLDNFPQAQQFSSNFDLTQSQSKFNQSSNQLTNVSSQTARKKYPGITIRSTNNDCNSSNFHEFRTPHNQTTNLCSFPNTVLNASSIMSEEPQSMGCKNQFDHKQKQFNNKSSSLSRCKDDMQLSEEVSETSFVSIAPQNIPSDIEFSQTSLNKFTTQKQKEPLEILKGSAKHVETNIEKNIIFEKGLQPNTGQELSPKQIEDLKSKPKNDNRGKDLSWSDFLDATKELKCLFEQLSGINEQDEEQPATNLEENSLDKSSDCELLEESTREDIDVSLLAQNDSKGETNEKNKETNEFNNKTSITIAQIQVEASQSSFFVEEKSSSNKSDTFSMDISRELESVSNRAANTISDVDSNSTNVDNKALRAEVSINTNDFVTTRKRLKYRDRDVVNDKETTSDDMSPGSSCVQKGMQSSNKLQSHEIDKNINVILDRGIIFDEGNTQPAANINLIDEHISNVSKRSKKLQEAVEQVLSIKKNINTNKRHRTLSEQLPSVSSFPIHSSFSQPSEMYPSQVSEILPYNLEVHPNPPELKSSEIPSEATNGNSEKNVESKAKTISVGGFIPFGSIQKIEKTDEEFVGVPMIMVEKHILNILSPELISHNSPKDRFPIKINIELIIPECTENLNDKPQSKLPIQAEYKKTKLVTPSISKKKTAPKKQSKPTDFVQQRTHCFSSIPLKSCIKQNKSKVPSLLAVEECDFHIEDASQKSAIATVSQILGTDCTYFENSELLRNLADTSIPHYPEVPELQIEKSPQNVPTPPPTTNKVINLIPITLSEGVTARKVWQVNLQWKSQSEMSIEVKFSVNRRSMTACDESAKLLFNFPTEIWSDVHRVLREIDRFEYKRRAFKNQRKCTSLHKVLAQLFNSSTQVVDVSIINDCYNPFTICEKTIPVYRKPFQCLTKGIKQNILNKMKFLKQSLQDKTTLT